MNRIKNNNPTPANIAQEYGPVKKFSIRLTDNISMSKYILIDVRTSNTPITPIKNTDIPKNNFFINCINFIIIISNLVLNYVNKFLHKIYNKKIQDFMQKLVNPNFCTSLLID